MNCYSIGEDERDAAESEVSLYEEGTARIFSIVSFGKRRQPGETQQKKRIAILAPGRKSRK